MPTQSSDSEQFGRRELFGGRRSSDGSGRKYDAQKAGSDSIGLSQLRPDANHPRSECWQEGQVPALWRIDVDTLEVASRWGAMERHARSDTNGFSRAQLDRPT